MKKKILLYTILIAFFTAGAFLSYNTYKQISSYVEKKREEERQKREAFAKRANAWKLLKKNIEKRLIGYKGITGIIIKDLDQNWEINSNKNIKIPSASMVKVPIMAAYFYAEREGKVDFQTKIEMRNKDRVPGSGTLKFAAAGEELSIEELIERMVTESDNTAANMLIKYMGFDALNSYFSKMGLKHTNLSRKMMDFKERKIGVENFTTAADMAYLLEQMYKGKFLDAATSKRCLNILARQKVKDRIPKKLPKEVVIAHKTGLENGLCHDAGVVYTNKGNFLICVLTRHAYKNARESKELIADIALLVYNYYGSF